MDNFRARIRGIAEEALDDTYFGPVRGIEDAILRAIEELLAREPTEGMLEAGAVEVGRAETTSLTTRVQDADRIYRAMSAQLLKEVKDGR